MGHKKVQFSALSEIRTLGFRRSTECIWQMIIFWETLVIMVPNRLEPFALKNLANTCSSPSLISKIYFRQLFQGFGCTLACFGPLEKFQWPHKGFANLERWFRAQQRSSAIALKRFCAAKSATISSQMVGLSTL